MDYLKLYGVFAKLSELRPLSDMKFSEVNKIVSILIDKDKTCGYIEFADDKKDFLIAIFKKEECEVGEKYDYVDMGIQIDSDFDINYVWNYHYKNGTAQSSQKLSNQHKITAYLIERKFDIFGLLKKEEEE
jgi:hypothetical protein